MKDGFLKVAAATPKIKVAYTEYNADSIISCMKDAYAKDVKCLIFPELCITAYTCQDLFFQSTLIKGAQSALLKIITASEGKKMLVAVGLPVLKDQKLFNCAAVIYNGELLGIVPKTQLPNYGEFYEARHFAPAPDENSTVLIGGKTYPFGKKLLFCCEEMPQFKLAIELCEDLWAPCPQSNAHAAAGAYIIGNLSASDEVIGKDKYRSALVQNQSARLICGYIYASAGDGESTQDMVFSGHNIIAENGGILKQSTLFENEITISEIDLDKLCAERVRMSTYAAAKPEGYKEIYFSMPIKETELTRFVAKTPFIPYDESEKNYRCSLILQMQAQGLKKRLEHTGSKRAVIGISGGLDSSLALLVCVKAMDLLSRPHSDILAVTMPCFGTTERTKSNAVKLCEAMGVSLETVDITKSVRQHFADIGHDESVHDVVYENGQARERTKVLMDIANREGGLVIGTGDLSELALGWATYNGDHMSMYGVNASVPKTLVRHIVKYYADTCEYQPISDVLNDILDTPVSPELLPAEENGEIAQKTEDLVGPYELHDFFLYYAIRFGFAPKKVKRLCMYAFGNDYDESEITKWLKVFYRRFFSQQFKRSCLPDGAKIGSVTLSPRGDLRMPSDAVCRLWLKQLGIITPNLTKFLKGHPFNGS